jgi:hypothetical protein
MIKLRELAHTKPRSATLGGDKLQRSFESHTGQRRCWISVFRSLRGLDIVVAVPYFVGHASTGTETAMLEHGW